MRIAMRIQELNKNKKVFLVSVSVLVVGLMAFGYLYISDVQSNTQKGQSSSASTSITQPSTTQQHMEVANKGESANNNANAELSTAPSVSKEVKEEAKQEREVRIANILSESVFLFWEKKPSTKPANTNDNRTLDTPPMPPPPIPFNSNMPILTKDKTLDTPPMPPPPIPFNSNMPILTKDKSGGEDITPKNEQHKDILVVYGYYCVEEGCVAFTNHGEIKNSGYIRGVGGVRVSPAGVVKIGE